MKLFKKNTLPPYATIPAFSFFLLTMLLFFSNTGLAAESQKTLFIPLKIVSLSDRAILTTEVDRTLAEALAGTDFSMLSRQEAENSLNYQEEWPPSPQLMAGNENFHGYNNIITGTFTEIGGRISLDLKLFDLLSVDDPRHLSAQGEKGDDLLPLFAGMLQKMAAYTSSDSIIASIAPAGNRKIDSGAILKNITTQPGDPYDPAQLREDLKSIFKMGYFDDIQIEVQQQENGKAVLFRIVEKPVIRSISFSGIDELKEEDIQEIVTTKQQAILNPAQINRDAEAIQLFYKTKGYYNTTVTPKTTFPTEDSAEIAFIIDEGEKIYIQSISFEGNTTFDDDTLEDEIETSTKGWFSWITDSGLLDYDRLNQDAGRIINFYGNHGFLETKIGDPVVTQEEEWLFITFIIEEGTRFKVGDIQVQGDVEDNHKSLLDILAITKEEFLSRKTLREDILKITDFYAERGYANANVRPIITAAEQQNTLDIAINIDKGELVYINRITIAGNDRTRDNVIRRELTVSEGGIFNAKALRDSLQNLQYLDFFEEVGITPEKAFDDTTVDLSIEVKEKSTGMFTIGAGYSSVDDLVLMGEIAENNFLGRGDTLALSANVGGDSNRYNLQYKNPRLNDSQLSWGIDLFDTMREFDDYTRDSTGGTLSFGYPVWEKWRGFGSYSYIDTTLTDVAEDASFIIRNSVDINITSAVQFSLRRDTRNKRFGATKGSRHNISVRYAGGPLGGDSEFTKVEGSTGWYFPLFWDTVFFVHGAAGQVFENENGGLPVYERFFLGGLNSIRGFDYGKVSPRDPVTDERIGGDKMWYTNFEFIFPLLAEQGINGVAFFDMGYVFNDDEDWNFDDYKKSVGVGIRWFSPIGPLRLEWGYNLDPQDDEDDAVWDFSIGGVF
ncbi:MAG: outer membrane protein assembly factor BamA [Desulfopila sp.]|nr:outer membrane protein assembly factor BamA [Desulfopila sp.]